MTSIERTILALCSRDCGHEKMYGLLGVALKHFDQQSGSWEHLVREAEIQGIVPLVHKHIAACQYHIPKKNRRLLQTLTLRTDRVNLIRNRLIINIIKTFKNSNIDILLLKGIALCHTVYSNPASRTMRDIDFLVRNTDTEKAFQLLLEMNFEQESDHQQLPDDYHHLTPLTATIEGFPITLEIHRELLPKHYNLPSCQFDTLSAEAMTFSINNTSAQTLGLEKTLYYKYLHGFQAPLTFEPFRLVHVADIVSMVERYSDTIDWVKLEHMFPNIYNILSRLHFLTPWHPKIIDALKLDISKEPDHIGIPYCGWPSRKFKSVPSSELFGYLKNTIWPSQWWTQVYYGHLAGKKYLKARLFQHPRTIWRWARTHHQSHNVAQ